MIYDEFQLWKHNIAYIAIDNGVTGAVAVNSSDYVDFFKTPTVDDIQYTKKPQGVTRLDGGTLYRALAKAAKCSYRVYILIERPLVNPRRFIPSMSAVRCLEATLVVLGMLNDKYGNIYYRYIDSREWQGAMIPRVTGDALKTASTKLAIERFPDWHMQLMRQDGDAPCMLLYMLERTKWMGREKWRIPNQKAMVIPHGIDEDHR